MSVNASIANTAGYHKHVDGLRALAIALVLLYHFEVAGAARGFLGVDIFFVISGYLVGGHILRETNARRFSLIDFYCRRIARIVPALVAVAGASLVAGYLILLPEDFVRLGAGIYTAMKITANQHFFASQDYFVPGKLNNYFLHSWSLSIEEQFYLLFPFAGLILALLPQGKFRIIAVLAAASWSWQFWLSSEGNLGSFYYLFARSWELLVGVLVSMAHHDRASDKAAIGWLAWLGLAMATVPAFIADSADFFVAMALQSTCVAGTALLLWSNIFMPDSRLARLLSLRGFVAIGLISYSLYLIHWPLLTLAHYWLILPPTLVERVVLLLLSIGLAWASWRWIEMPARNWVRTHPSARGTVILVGLATVILFAIAGRFVGTENGLPQRVPTSALAKYNQKNSYSPLREKCHSDENSAPIAPDKACKLGAATADASVAIWADSHGAELAFELHALFKAKRAAIIQITSSGCPPLLNVDIPSVPGCAAHNNATIGMLKSTASIRTIVIMWHQNAYLDVDAAERLAGFRRSLKALVAGGMRVVVVGPLPMAEYHVPSVMARIDWAGGSGLPLSQSVAAFYARSSATTQQLRTISAQEGAVFFDPAGVFCNEARCSYVDGKTAIYFDDNHLSLAGARKLALALTKGALRRTVKG